MKVLQFIISSNINSLVEKIIDYLIDAGHFVNIHSLCAEDNIIWKKKYKYNFKIIEDSEIESINFDYVIDFCHNLEIDNAYKINFVLDFLEEFPTLSFFIERDLKSSVIGKPYLINQSISITTNYNNIIDAIVESFIDSVIYLLRFGKDDLLFNSDLIDGSAKNLFYYEDLLSNLSAYYSNFENNEDVFLIQNIVNYNSKDNDYIDLDFSLDNGFTLKKNDLEIIAIYFLRLLNSRKNGVYVYDIQLTKSNSISKFIEVKESSSYKDLCNQFTNEIYNVVDSNFFVGKTLSDGNIKPKVILLYDQDISSNMYDLYLAYNSETHKLQLRYKADLYFFDSYSPLLENFISNYQKFVSIETNF